jgi:hypothetical protein
MRQFHRPQTVTLTDRGYSPRSTDLGYQGNPTSQGQVSAWTTVEDDGAHWALHVLDGPHQ